MQLNAYTIHDSVALQYHTPWFAVTDGAATRILSDLVNDVSTRIGAHPKDYRLYRCGVWDDNKGTFVPEFPLVHIVDAVALLSVSKQDELPLTPVQRAQSTVDTINGKGR